MVGAGSIKFNCLIASVVSAINLGICRRLRFVKMIRTHIAIRVLRILYREGVIRTFVVYTALDLILVYYKYSNGINICLKLTLISTPGNRCFWTLTKLAKVYSNYTFTGFYILSTHDGMVTSNYCLLQGHSGGEVLIKVDIT